MPPTEESGGPNSFPGYDQKTWLAVGADAAVLTARVGGALGGPV